jgi:glycosyltransferase involved in cell wall biosynthesis
MAESGTPRVTEPAKKLRIVQLAVPDAVGGLERVLQALAIGHHRRGHDVCVAAVMDEGTRDDHPFLVPLRAHGVPVRVLEVPPRGYHIERRLVARLLDEFRPDVVHFHGYRPDVLDVGLARKRRIPVVTTLHGSSRMGGLSTIHEWIQLALLRRFDAVIAVSKPLVQELGGRWVSRHRLHFIPNAWTGRPPSLDRAKARQQLGLPAGGVVLGWVGRLIEVKAADVFLRALALLQDRPWHASLVGDGRRRPSLERLANQLGLAHRVTFHGSVYDISQAFRAFDVFILSSRSEGTPVVLFEAMVAGIPVVATHVGGVVDVLPEGTALLVPSQNPRAMAEAIRRILDDPVSAQARAAAAVERLHAHYGVEPWLEAHEQLYDGLAGSRGRLR